MQHGGQAVKRQSTPLEQIDTNIFSPIKKFPRSETSPTTSDFDDTSCASFSSTLENNTNDFVDESLSARSSPTINSSLLSPTSVKCTCNKPFKKPSFVKGKFNPNISIKRDGKNKELDNDDLELSFMNLNKAVTEHLNSRKNVETTQMQNDPDTSFCNLVIAELKQMEEKVKQIKKQEILQILWRKE